MMASEKILIANNAKKHHEIYDSIAEGLSSIDLLQHIKIYRGSMRASNFISDNGKKEPIVKMGEPNVVGLELLIDEDSQVVQFFAITSATKGYGEKMVSSVVSSVPNDWKIIILMDWSCGFWQVMMQRYPQLIVV
jgi:hypothetical protein